MTPFKILQLRMMLEQMEKAEKEGYVSFLRRDDLAQEAYENLDVLLNVYERCVAGIYAFDFSIGETAVALGREPIIYTRGVGRCEFAACANPFKWHDSPLGYTTVDDQYPQDQMLRLWGKKNIFIRTGGSL